MSKLYLGDCMGIIPTLDDKSIDLIVTDAPYLHDKSPGLPYSQRHQCNTKSKFSNSELYNYDGEMIHAMSDFGKDEIYAFLSCVEPKMKIMNAYMFCSEAQVPHYCTWATEHNYMFSILVWEKPLSIINKNRFSQNLEYIVRVYDYGTALNRLAENEFYNRVKRIKPVAGTDKSHPTEKPVQLMQQFIELSSKEGDTILDPFMGSGTTCVACVRTKREYIGMELTEKYYKVANNRVKAEESQLTLF